MENPGIFPGNFVIRQRENGTKINYLLIIETIQMQNKTKTVYVSMVADLFHYGHAQFLKKAKQYGTKLVVGLHNDEDVAKYKRIPILTMNERWKVLKTCKYVDEVILHAPLETTDTFMNKHNLDIYKTPVQNPGMCLIFSLQIHKLNYVYV